MASALTRLLQEITPPIAWRGMRSVATRMRPGSAMTEPVAERPAAWYDAVYQTSTEYRLHYTESRYYFLWTVIVDRLLRSPLPQILDLGCGPGQFAELLADKGIVAYRGLDFSQQCIEQARQRCPTFQFDVADISSTPLLEESVYDTVIALEFLEHVEQEIHVIRRLRKGAHFLASVPNFPYTSHVRHFTSTQEVQDRYGACFSRFRVDAFDEDAKGKRYYLMDGVVQ
jgi:2-polyprenyl-3-methyl-5-hydroxy-6-metoxy-1,4-benzoquinol methylase